MPIMPGLQIDKILNNLNENEFPRIVNDVSKDLYSTELRLLSNTGNNVTKNIILVADSSTIPFFCWIVFCIRDSLREYKSYYVTLSSMKLSLYNCCIISESAVFNLLFW